MVESHAIIHAKRYIKTELRAIKKMKAFQIGASEIKHKLQFYFTTHQGVKH